MSLPAYSFSLCQQQLPATGVPITRQRFDQMREMFDEYVRACTLQNWKFWVVSFVGRRRTCVKPAGVGHHCSRREGDGYRSSPFSPGGTEPGSDCGP